MTTVRKRRVFPFTQVVGQEEMKLALLLNVIDPRIGGSTSGSRPVMFRGTVEVTGLDGASPGSRPLGRRSFHLVQRAGEPSPAFGTISLAPGASRQLQVRLIYPADATPPQVLSLLPLPDPAMNPAVKQSESNPASRP